MWKSSIKWVNGNLAVRRDGEVVWGLGPAAVSWGLRCSGQNCHTWASLVGLKVSPSVQSWNPAPGQKSVTALGSWKENANTGTSRLGKPSTQFILTSLGYEWRWLCLPNLACSQPYNLWSQVRMKMWDSFIQKAGKSDVNGAKIESIFLFSLVSLTTGHGGFYVLYNVFLNKNKLKFWLSV